MTVWSSSSSGVVLANNTTSSLLSNGSTYTGTWVDVSQFASVVIACYSDKSGLLYAEFSSNATDADSSLSYSVSASTNEVHRLTVSRQFFRVRFTNNSGSTQTTFRLQCIAGNQTQLTSPLNSVVQSDQDTTVVRPLDFNLMVAENLYQNRQNTIKDGLTPSISSGAVTQDLWTTSGAYTGFPRGSVEAGEIVVAGADTGTVYYSYLASSTDTDYTFASKAITGAGTYALGHNIWRSNFAYFVSSSATAFNAGNITLRNTVTTANIFWVISAGVSQTQCAAYTVPYNSDIYLDRFSGNLRGGSTATLDGYLWYRAVNESPRYRFPFILQFGTLWFDDIDFLIKIPSQTDIMPRIINSSANAIVGQFTYRFVKVKQ